MEDKKQFALKIINKKNLEKPKAKQKVPEHSTSDDILDPAAQGCQTQKYMPTLACF